jgi:hypothetical protein
MKAPIYESREAAEAALPQALADFAKAVTDQIPGVIFTTYEYQVSGGLRTRPNHLEASIDGKVVGTIYVVAHKAPNYGRHYLITYSVDGARIPRKLRRTYYDLTNRESIHIKSLMKFVKLGFRPDNQRELFEAARKSDEELRRIKYELHDLDQIDKEAFMGGIYNTTINLAQLKEILFEAYGLVPETERTNTLKQRLMDHPVKRAALQQEYNNRLGDITLQFDL